MKKNMLMVLTLIVATCGTAKAASDTDSFPTADYYSLNVDGIKIDESLEKLMGTATSYNCRISPSVVTTARVNTLSVNCNYYNEEQKEIFLKDFQLQISGRGIGLDEQFIAEVKRKSIANALLQISGYRAQTKLLISSAKLTELQCRTVEGQSQTIGKNALNAITLFCSSRIEFSK